MDPIAKIGTKKLLRVVGLVAFCTLLGGSIFYHYTERLSWVDSFYFSTVTLATVGYGDIVPRTNTGKIFTIFYILGGIGIIVAFANILVRRAGERAVEKAKKRKEEKANK
ncbi:two pore domain potassium channel family protein [Candidatus Saccharibacteria bacterium]|nr:two pore domain potassium channel family protein [Candidatus Saccharibacteria bacterium]